MGLCPKYIPFPSQVPQKCARFSELTPVLFATVLSLPVGKSRTVFPLYFRLFLLLSNFSLLHSHCLGVWPGGLCFTFPLRYLVPNAGSAFSPKGVLGDLLQPPRPFSMGWGLEGLLWASMMVSPGLRLMLLRDERLSPNPTQVWPLKHHRLGLVKLQSAAVEPEETTGKMLRHQESLTVIKWLDSNYRVCAFKGPHFKASFIQDYIFRLPITKILPTIKLYANQSTYLDSIQHEI